MRKKKGKKEKHSYPQKNNLLAAIVILLVTLIAYSNTFDVPFQFDDRQNIERNQEIRSFEKFGKLSFWTNVNKRPLPLFTLAVNYAIGGLDVRSFHVFNFIFHVICGLCTYFLALLLFRQSSRKTALNNHEIYYKALVVSLIFVLHPLQTMGTTYIVQRMASLSALFYILSVFLYTKGRLLISNKANIKIGIYTIVLAGITGVMAILSKQNALTLPLMFLMVEIYFIRNESGKVYRKYITFGLSIIILSVSVIIALGMLPKEAVDISRWDYLITQFRALLKYIWLLFIPVGQNIDHGLNVSESIGLLEVIGMIVYAGLIISVKLLYTRHKLLSFGIAWFLITNIVESSIIPISDVMVEHRLYLPMFGFSLFFVDGIYFILKGNMRKYLTSSLIIILILLTTLTYSRNKTWQSWNTIWLNSLKQNPDNVRAITNVGYGYKMDKKPYEAIKYYTSAIKKDSSYYVAYLNRGISYFDLKEYKLAIRDLDVYLSKHTDRDSPYFFRGVSYGHLGKYDKALADLNSAIQLNPKFGPSYKNRGVIYELMRNYKEAIPDFNKALELEPENTTLLINRSKAYFVTGKYRKALVDAQEAMKHGHKVDPGYIKDLKRKLENREKKKKPIPVTID